MHIENIIKKALEESMSYLHYRTLVESHAINGTNTGEEVTDSLANYTKLNHQRMKRHDKRMELSADTIMFLAGFKKNIAFICLTESWCGDAAQTMPMIAKIAIAGGIDFKIVLRDDHPELMNQFLTDGNQSIPKLIIIDADNLSPLAVWGPRPTAATRLVATEKAEKGSLSLNFKEQLQGWYNTDRGKSTEEDIIHILKQQL
jgi:hypothetical protein